MRMYNTNMKQKSVKNIHDAIDDLHKKKNKAHKEVIETLSMLKR